MSERPRPRLRLNPRLVAAVVVVSLGAVVFLAGPSGLVSIWSRERRARRLERDVAAVRERIAARSAVRAALADPDSAQLLARRVFGADSVTAPDSADR